MGGPLFVWGWFFFWLGIAAVPMNTYWYTLYAKIPSISYIPLFLNWRTLIAFLSGCGMVPVVRFLDYSHDEDCPWLGENDQGKVFGKWWLGTNGTYFGVRSCHPNLRPICNHSIGLRTADLARCRFSSNRPGRLSLLGACSASLVSSLGTTRSMQAHARSSSSSIAFCKASMPAFLFRRLPVLLWSIHYGHSILNPHPG